MVHRFFSVVFFSSVRSFERSCPSGREDADARVSFAGRRTRNKTNGTCDDYYSAGTRKMHNLVIPRAR